MVLWDYFFMFLKIHIFMKNYSHTNMKTHKCYFTLS